MTRSAALEPDEATAAGGRSRRPVGRRAAVVLVAAAAPWSWFLVRDIHPLFGLVAVGLPLVVLAAMAAVAVAAILLRWVSVLAAEASLVVFGAVAIMGPWQPVERPEPVQRLVLLSANMLGPEEPAAAEAGVESVRRAGADVVVVVELSPIVARSLTREYPYHAQSFPEGEENPRPPAVGIFSRFPLTDAAVRPGDLPGVRSVIDAGPAGRFVLYAVHVPKPAVGRGPEWSISFGGHDQIVDRLVDAAMADTRPGAAGGGLPVVVAGDFNTTDRSRAYRRLTSELHDAARADRTGPTSVKSSLVWRLLALRVDHVFQSGGWCSANNRRVELVGSDHRGVRVELGPCPTR